MEISFKRIQERIKQLEESESEERARQEKLASDVYVVAHTLGFRVPVVGWNDKNWECGQVNPTSHWVCVFRDGAFMFAMRRTAEGGIQITGDDDRYFRPHITYARLLCPGKEVEEIERAFADAIKSGGG